MKSCADYLEVEDRPEQIKGPPVPVTDATAGTVPVDAIQPLMDLGNGRTAEIKKATPIPSELNAPCPVVTKASEASSPRDIAAPHPHRNSNNLRVSTCTPASSRYKYTPLANSPPLSSRPSQFTE